MRTFREYFTERADRLKTYDEKIIRFLRSEESKQYQKNEFVFEIPLNVLVGLGIDRAIIEDLEVNSSGSDKFMVLFMPKDEQVVIYLSKQLKDTY